MRPTLDGEIPTASAIVARLHCVASGGASRTAFAITFRRVSRGSGGTPVQIVKAPSIREVADEVAIDVVMAIPERPGQPGTAVDQGDSEED